jgi:hypothetical protein
MTNSRQSDGTQSAAAVHIASYFWNCRFYGEGAICCVLRTAVRKTLAFKMFTSRNVLHLLVCCRICHRNDLLLLYYDFHVPSHELARLQLC